MNKELIKRLQDMLFDEYVHKHYKDEITLAVEMLANVENNDIL